MTVERKYLTAVPVFKFLLILGVVLIHSNPASQICDENGNCGFVFVDFVTSFMQTCVPSFYIISGYLFFINIGRPSATYLHKLKSRVRTLLIPYLVWNSICAALFVIKVKYLGFPGLGIIEDGTIDWGKFFLGFIYRQQADGYPFAFAFYFIRNLMLFVLLSPTVWFISRRWWTMCLFILMKIVFDLNLLGIEWFVIGSAAGIHRFSFEKINSRLAAIVSFAVYIAFGYVRFFTDDLSENMSQSLLVIEVLAAFYSVYFISQKLSSLSQKPGVMKTLCSSTFFIYAFHQLFCSITVKFWLRIFGTGSFAGPVLTYVFSFLTMFFISFAIYMSAQRICSRILSTITGGRE